MRQQPEPVNGGTILLAGRLGLTSEARCYLEERYRLVRIASDAAAVAWLQTHVPDLVIGGLEAARGGGYSFCRAIVQNRALTSVSILLLSLDSLEGSLAALRQGADDCLGFPLDLQRFRARVENLLARSRRIRESLACSACRWQSLALDNDGWAIRNCLVPEEGSFIKKVDEAIDANLENAQFNVPLLARSVATGRASLYRQLKMLRNISPGRLILERRLHHAALLFTNCQKTVTEVAYTVGFKSLSHFSRSFRKYHGVTPAAYLKRASHQESVPN